MLVHYDDLSDDLDGQMRRLARHLEVTVDDARWPELVEAAEFDAMRTRSAVRAPDHLGVLKSSDAFFRSEARDRGGDQLDEESKQRCLDRVGELARPDVARWLLH